MPIVASGNALISHSCTAFGKFVIQKMTETMTITLEAPLRFTEGALIELRRLMDETAFDHSQALRVGVKGGGCSGLSYVLGFDAPEPDDDRFEISGIPVLMKKAHGIYLQGMEVHFEQGLNARGFTFSNPNASSSCGCGSSFAV